MKRLKLCLKYLSSTEVKEATIIIYNLVKEEPAVEKVEAPVAAAEEEVKEASVIPVVVEEKPVEVEEVGNH